MGKIRLSSSFSTDRTSRKALQQHNTWKNAEVE